MFDRFVEEVGRHDDLVVFAYGGYERAFLKRMRKSAKRLEAVDRLLGRLVNVLSLVHAHVYFPTYSNGLKDVAGCLGCSWSEPDAAGLQSLVWRAKWEAGHPEEWQQKLLTYNLDDCAALRKVTEFVSAVTLQGEVCGAFQNATTGPRVSRVQELDRWSNDRKWGKVNFVHPDFDHINTCAYFDYQRERVFVRANAKLRRRRQKREKSPNRSVRTSLRVQVVSTICPRCGGKELVNGVRKAVRTQEPRLKRAFDLVWTPGGIRRRVIVCRTTVHRCLTCGEEFVPEHHQRLDRHFHGLKSWAMYLHVAHRLSLQTISTMLEDCFGLRVHATEMQDLKGLMARHYGGTWRGLLQKILAGNLLHVDETEVKHKEENGVRGPGCSPTWRKPFTCTARPERGTS